MSMVEFLALYAVMMGSQRVWCSRIGGMEQRTVTTWVEI